MVSVQGKDSPLCKKHISILFLFGVIFKLREKQEELCSEHPYSYHPDLMINLLPPLPRLYILD